MTKYNEHTPSIKQLLWWAFRLPALALLFISLFLLIGCSPAKRLDRFQKNHPYLFETVTDTVTITIHDTIHTETVRTDTIFHIDFDTVRIEKEKLKIRLIRQNDTIFVDGECVGDTVYVTEEIEVPIESTQPKRQEKDNTNWWIALAIASMFFITFIIYKFKR